MAEQGDGFLSRWSRRKQALREGKPVEAEPARVAPEVPVPAPAPAAGVSPTEAPSGSAEPEQPPAPTLDDVQALTPASDFRRFVAPEVAPEVKNAAMKKLFADPHFNVMDGLDVYIDDYGKPDPIPPAMLRQLASAKFLGLFDDEEEAAPGTAPPSAIASGGGPSASGEVAQDEVAPDATAQAPALPAPDPRATDPGAPAGSPPDPEAGPPGTVR